MLQEQYWSTFTKSAPIHHAWTLIEPTVNDTRPRAAIYTNNNLISPSRVTPLTLPFKDVAAAAITITNTKPMLIVNIYNPCDQRITTELHEYLRRNINRQDYGIIVVGGDFNAHHPLWNPRTYTRHDEEADEIVEMMTELELNLMLPAGSITYPHANTTIDLVWGNEEARNRIITCRVAEEKHHGSDHLPIETTLALHIEKPQTVQPFNYARTDWKELNNKLEQYLPNLPNLETITCASIDKYTEELIKAITKAVEETTPRKRPSPHSKRWWNENIGNLRHEANRLRNIYRRTKSNIDKVAWRAKEKEHDLEIEKARTDKWREFINTADEKTMYQINKYINSIPTPTFIPTLDTNAATNEEKIGTLRKAFFPKPPPADLKDIRRARYPEEVPYEHQITIRQIRNAVEKLASEKAPGPDEIANIVIKKTLPLIEQHLQALMQASIDLGHFPKPFKQTNTVVLRKPGKPDYTVTKAYRPIALENTLGKVLESVMADTISYLTETYELLPAHHYGGRPGRSAEDAMMILTENIHKAWKNKKIYTAVFMDVAGAFNNVHHERLIHNLKKRRLPTNIAKWISSFLQKRSTQLLFNGTKSQSIPTPAGIPQGSPLSPLLYMYYNADLLDIPQQRGTGLGFIDDITYGVEGFTDKGNARKLNQLLREAEEWRKKHGVQFETSKYILVHFTRNYNQATNAAITVGKVTIEPSNEAKYLGVIFDKELRFKAHLQYIVKKGTKAAMALSRIAKSSWGLKYKYARQLYTAVITARTDYAAVVWHRPKDGNTMATSTQACKLDKIQRLAMKAITGCYKTTATAAMEIETGLQPSWLRLQTKTLQAITRMQTLSKKHPLHEWLASAMRTRTAQNPHQTNLENVLQQFPLMTENIETIEPYIRPPWWTPKVEIKIDTTKDKAKDQHYKILHENSTAPTIYTDGSGIKGKIGAAIYDATKNETRHRHLGKDTQYNVYTAELAALQLAIETLRDDHEQIEWRIFTDSQAAIKATNNPHRQSGQAIIKDFLDCVDDISDKYPHLHIKIIWIPGHAEIEGNERADAEAKKAAIQAPTSRPYNHKPLKSARIRVIKEMARKQWDKEWNENTKTAKALRRITKRKGTKTGPKLYNEIPGRDAVAKIVQLRTGHCGLNHYLHRFGKRNSPYCECGMGKETVEHYLLECRRYKEQRKMMIKDIGKGRLNIERLLGQPQTIKSTVDFIRNTKRL